MEASGLTDAELEAEARRIYRVSGTEVQHLHEGQWVTGHWSINEAAAQACLEKCVKRYVAWAKMTAEERMRSILR